MAAFLTSAATPRAIKGLKSDCGVKAWVSSRVGRGTSGAPSPPPSPPPLAGGRGSGATVPEFSRPRALKADASLCAPPKAEASLSRPPATEGWVEGWSKGESTAGAVGSACTGLPSCTSSLRLDQRLKNPSVILGHPSHCHCHCQFHRPHPQTFSRWKPMPDCQTGPSMT